MRGQLASAVAILLGLGLVVGVVLSMGYARADDSYQSLDDGLLIMDKSENSLGTDIWDDGTDGVEPYWVSEEPGQGSPQRGKGLDTPVADETDPFCLHHDNDVTHIPTVADIEWKPFTPFNPTGGEETTASLLLDRYNPPTPLSPGTYPILILAHGGGWWRGCRWLTDDAAYAAANDGANIGQKFITLSIDYRMACDPDNQYAQEGYQMYLMCGWHFTTIDPDTDSNMAAVGDIQDAVVWAKENVNIDCGNVCWDGERVYVAGGSSGGNLAMMAALFSTTDGNPNNRPTAVAAWSGIAELSHMSSQGNPNYEWGCTNSQTWQYETDDESHCWDGEDQYLDPVLCPFGDGQGPESTCHDANNVSYYELASPWYYADDTEKIDIVPIFFANGGGPTAGASPIPSPTGTQTFQAGPELIALQEDKDLASKMSGWSTNNFRECTVDTNLHGMAYLSVKPCHGSDTRSVWKRTLLFFLSFP